MSKNKAPTHPDTAVIAVPWRRPATLSVLLLLLAFFLRLYRLDGQPLRGDEAATILYSALPITKLWELSRVTDPHPPLYYLLLHPWQGLVGESGWSMRFAGVVASTLSVAALWALARRTLRSTGLALTAIDPQYIEAVTLMPESGTRLDEALRGGQFLMPDAAGLLRELRVIVAETHVSQAVFRTNHALEYLDAGGNLPVDQTRILGAIDSMLARDSLPPLQPEDLRSL